MPRREPDATPREFKQEIQELFVGPQTDSVFAVYDPSGKIFSAGITRQAAIVNACRNEKAWRQEWQSKLRSGFRVAPAHITEVAETDENHRN